MSTTVWSTEYEVWSERDGVVRRRTTSASVNVEPMKEIADAYNVEEAALASMEMRQVRTRFFVAKVTTSYEEVKS